MKKELAVVESVEIVELDDAALEGIVGGTVIIGNTNCGCANNCNCKPIELEA